MNVFETIEFEVIVQYAIAIVVLCSVLAALLYMIWGGFLIILSAGSEEKVKSAINHIRHAVLGIIVLMLVLFIVPVITRLIGLPYGDYLKPKQVLQTISEISGRVFGTQADSEIILEETPDTIPSNFSDL
ncbi:hypothetical protein HOO68_05320 [Candidatus Gracilibacteria bacterium]|nr:hypothetical protein [Candidatus Gracilibacteria bacterium]